MRKPLTQIAFDFGAPPEPAKETRPAESLVQSVGPAVQEELEEPVVEPNEVEEPYEAVVEEELVIISGNDNYPEKTQTVKKTSGRGRRSLVENARKADLIDIPPDEELFKKSYYPIGEVARMFNEKQSLVRYWESEFDILKPRKNKKGDRYFRPVDIKNLVLIHDLLRRRKFTIEGAKEYLRKNKKAEEKFALIQSLEKMKAFFLELKSAL